MITVFKDFADTANPHYVSVDHILNRIREGKVRDKVENIRNEADPKKRRELKKQLPCICFSGRFTSRKDGGIVEHSSFAILDFDHLEDVVAKKAEISTHQFVYAVFVSPSGDGLKALVRIPPDIKRHQGHYRALNKMFPQIDPANKNISRICFESYDPDIYINKEASVFDEYIEDTLVKNGTPQKTESAIYTDYAKVNRALSMIRDAADGEKHAVLLKASGLMGGYIAGGLVEEHEGIRLLEQEIQKKNIDDFDAASDTIKKGIEYGKGSPIQESYTKFTQTAPVPVSSGIRTVDSVWERMKHGFTHGKQRGDTTHFGLLNENFSWKKGELTLFIGRPNSGKTEFMLHLMLLKSCFDGWKWGVFSPENYPEDEFYDSLIHSYIGKTTDPHYRDTQMSMEEYRKGYEFIREYFFYVYPETDHTIEEIEGNFLHLVENKKINGTFIDPFNQLTPPSSKIVLRDDQYLSPFLTKRKLFTVKHNLCSVISSHPRNMQKNSKGGYDVPDIYDIAGGAMWANKVDNIIAIDRPNYIIDPKDTIVNIHVKKIKKQRLVGVPGMCPFDYQRARNRYYQNGFSPLESSDGTSTGTGDPSPEFIPDAPEEKRDNGTPF